MQKAINKEQVNKTKCKIQSTNNKGNTNTKMQENILKSKIHEFVKLVYELTQNFPKYELY